LLSESNTHRLFLWDTGISDAGRGNATGLRLPSKGGVLAPSRKRWRALEHLGVTLPPSM